MIFVERFEEAALSEVFKRWTDVRNGSAMSLSSDVPPGSPGSRSLNIPWVGGGLNNGGHLYKQLSPGIGDTLYVRYYIKHPASGNYRHTGIWMGGYHPPLSWPNPQAGEKPAGNDRFIAAAEQNTLTARLDHYNYWVDMHQSVDGNYWGNVLLNDPNVQARAGQWMCVEHMVKLNNPLISSNGEHAIWLDGVKVSHLGRGFPNGYWSGGIFTQDPSGSPFGGFRWRSDANLNLNWIWLQNYAPGDPAGFRGDMKFDHVVVAKTYIGCLPAAPPTEASVTHEGATNPWPNEPTGFVPFNDQPWDLLTRAGPPTAGRVGRTLERIQAFLFRLPERRNDWSYLRRASSKDDDIVRDATAPFSPPHVLRIVFTPDMKKDHEPSVHWIGLSPRPSEIYTAWWMKLSANWTCSSVGCGKITFLWPPDGDGVAYSNIGGTNAPNRINIATTWSAYGYKFWEPNIETTPVNYGQWYRIEWYMKYESSPGAADGIIRWWVNGVLNGDYRNVRYPACCLQQFEFAPTLQTPPPAEQYMYIDHTYISTPQPDEEVPSGGGESSGRKTRVVGERR